MSLKSLYNEAPLVIFSYPKVRLPHLLPLPAPPCLHGMCERVVRYSS